MKYIYSVLLLFSAFAYFSPVVANDEFVKDIEIAREIYLKATDGNKRAVRRAIKTIHRLERKYKNHPLVLAYKGGALSLRGVNIGKRPLDRMRETEQGLNVLDRALRKLRGHKGHYLEAVEARLVAAYVFINLPNSYFHRLKEGNHLVEQLLAHPRFVDMPSELQAAIYFAAATSADKHKNQDQLKYYLQLTLKTDPDGKSSKEAQALLKRVEP
ncbi:MAG: hypothetical protein GXP14_16835 [Gammaproteobacteria bacterium]|nr:hypothetical protein [Gammaproteobacteria bacterium]